jgi:hypothetical protein
MKKELTERQRGWLIHLERARESGGTLKAYAQAHGISAGSLYEAKSRLTRAGFSRGAAVKSPRARAAFVPAHITPAHSTGAVCRLTHASGWVLECAALPAPAWLLAVVRCETDDAQA